MVRPPEDDRVARPQVDGGRPTGAERCSWPRANLHECNVIRVRAASFPLGSGVGRARHHPRRGKQHTSVRRARNRPRSRFGGRARSARGRERGGPTRSHPEPGRDPPQRRRVLGGRPPGRRGRRGPARRRRAGGRARRGVEQRQLVGLITQRSGVRIPPPPPSRPFPARPGTALLFNVLCHDCPDLPVGALFI